MKNTIKPKEHVDVQVWKVLLVTVEAPWGFIFEKINIAILELKAGEYRGTSNTDQMMNSPKQATRVDVLHSDTKWRVKRSIEMHLGADETDLVSEFIGSRCETKEQNSSIE